jgi:hypothetical protein
MPAKGEQETIYGGPWSGVDYSRPYNVLDPSFIAPGSVNTSQINGFLTSSPWLAKSPYAQNLGAGEYVLGMFPLSLFGLFPVIEQAQSWTLVITNLKVYAAINSPGTTFALGVMILIHTWTTEIDSTFLIPGNAVAFVEVNGIVFFTGLMLNGVFYVNGNVPTNPVFGQATNYVSAANIIELDGYLFVAQCRFPGGGGTGTGVLPTVAWSGPGSYIGSGASDPWNPANLLGGGFNELAEVPDLITGLAGIGRSALIFRPTGISQADPNPGSSNSGIQPFTFYHLWSSPQGVGAYQGTIAQYGQAVYFRSSDNAYSISISAGLSPIGTRIIPKIVADQRTVDNLPSVFNPSNPLNTGWYFSSIVNVAGQLHYLIAFSSLTLTPALALQTSAVVYDYNISENAWHLWDMTKYLQQNGAGNSCLGFSCPIVSAADVSGGAYSGGTVSAAVASRYFLFGALTGYGTPSALSFSGAVNQFVFWDYDFASNWIAAPFNILYAPLAMPNTTINFRAEVGTLGHKLTVRRLRIQADNAPLPSFSAGSQQQATVTFTGALAGNVQSKPLAWTQTSGQTVLYMQGNTAPIAAPIQTYYGDPVVSDEMVQPSLSSLVADPANPWNSLPAFRIATASLVWEDPKSTTQ